MARNIVAESCGFELDDPYGGLARKKPRNIDIQGTRELFLKQPESVKEWARGLVADDWRFYLVHQQRGYCDMPSRIITIPAWATNELKEGKGFLTWYICHEMAHAYDKCRHGHRKEFMQWLIKICPSNCIQHEMGYKPRNAKAAGIDLLDL